MTAYRMYAHRPADEPTRSQPGSSDAVALLGAVREDVRQTLRTAWVDTALEAAASCPVFFTAAWSAVRPNVGKSFLALARALRAEALDAVSVVSPPDLRKRLENTLADEELRRIEDSARAAHLAMAKIEIVVHVLHRAAHHERLGGTGREEPSVRRGIPEWQRWMSFQPAPEPARQVLEEAARVLGTPGPPTPLRLVARWPAALSELWHELRPHVGSDVWRASALRLRRRLMSGISSLPHPIELQWGALRARGLSERERAELAERLAAHDATLPAQTLVAAFVWTAFGAPDIGVES